MAKHKPNGDSRYRSIQTALAGMPWWVQGIAYVGAPVAAAAFMLYMFFGAFNTKLDKLDEIDKRLTAHELTAGATSVAFTKHLDDDTQQRWLLISTLQRICLNTSKSDSDRLACALSSPPR